MTATEWEAYTAALQRPTEPKVFCSSNRRNKWGRIAHSCSVHPGHENDHRDMHTGASWT